MPDYFGGFGGEDYTYRLPQQSVFGIRPGEGGVAGGLMQMLGPMVGEMVRKDFGVAGFTFGSGMNVESSIYLRRAYEQQMAARNAGAAADARSTEDLFRGIQAMINPTAVRGVNSRGQVTFTDEVERSVGVVSRDAARIGNVLAAMFPDEVDLATPGGSVAVGSARIANAGRYVRDSAGRTVADDSEFGVKVLGGLVSGDRRRTAGLRAGQVGALFEELTRSGMMGVGGDEINDDTVAKVQGRLEKYSKSVAAIRDIFAENGRANAPMRDLIAGLQTLTQGGLGKFDADELTRIARTYQGARQAFGVDIEALERMSGASGAMLRAAGVNPVLGTQIPLNAVAARAAFQQAGHFDAVGGFETLNQNELTHLVMSKQVAFAGSQAANQLAVVGQLGELAGEDTDLGRAAASLRRGSFDVRMNDGSKVNLLRMDQAALTAMAERSGVSAGAFLSRLQNTVQNQAWMARNQEFMASGSQQAQADEYRTVLRNQLVTEFGDARGGEAARLLAEAPGDTDDRKAAWVARRLGLQGEAAVDFAGRLGTVTGRVGQQYGAGAGVRTTGVAAGLLNSEEGLASMESARQLMQQLGIRNAATTHLGTGGILENLVQGSTAMGFLKNQARGLGDLLISMVGGVREDDRAAARADPRVGLNHLQVGGTLRIVDGDRVRNAVLNAEAAAGALGAAAAVGGQRPGGP